MHPIALPRPGLGQSRPRGCGWTGEQLRNLFGRLMRHDTRATDATPADAARPQRAPVWAPGWVQGYAVGDPVDVSVCIVNWNCKEHLRSCLRSLLEQPQGVGVEVVVVDNG